MFPTSIYAARRKGCLVRRIDSTRDQSAALFAVVVAVVTALRLAAIFVTPLELHADEMRYAVWARDLDWGYETKPPAIAWLIAATTQVFGAESPIAMRAPAPLLQAVAARIVFAIGARVGGARIGAAAGLILCLAPFSSLASFLMTTDVLAMPFYAGATFCALAMAQSQRQARRWAFALGLLLGVGFLCRYSTFYIGVGAFGALMALRAAKERGFVGGSSAIPVLALFWRAGLAFGFVIWPHGLWLAQHDWASVAHLADNAALGQSGSGFVAAAQFVLESGVVFGPFAWIALALGGRGLFRHATAQTVLLGFLAGVPVVISLCLALLGEANANWIAAGFPALAVLAAQTGLMVVNRAGHWLGGALAAIACLVIAEPGLADRLGMENGLKRLRGWEAFAAQASMIGRQAPADLWIADSNATLSALRYFRPDQPAMKAQSWLATAQASSAPGGALYFATNAGDADAVRARGFRLRAIADLSAPLGPRLTRRWSVYWVEPGELAPARRPAQLATSSPVLSAMIEPTSP